VDQSEAVSHGRLHRVIGIAGDDSTPKLVLGLRHGDGIVHHLGHLDTVICHFHRTRQPPRDVFHARSRRRSARKPWNDRTSMKVVIGDDLRCGESRPS